jgi:hypothetical protein
MKKNTQSPSSRAAQGETPQRSEVKKPFVPSAQSGPKKLITAKPKFSLKQIMR